MPIKIDPTAKRVDNRAVRYRGPRGWKRKLTPVKLLYWNSKKGWQPLPF